MFIKKPLILCLFLFGIISLKDTPFSLILLISFFYFQYKYKFTDTISILLFCFILFLSSINYSLFNNIVLETHQNYVIASVNHEKVLIYTDEIYFFGDKVEIRSDKEEIDSLSNFHIFDFKEYMHNLNIRFYYDEAIIHKKDSIQRNMYKYVNSFDEETKNVLLKIFYQFNTNQNIIYSSGMHYSYINQLITQFFQLLFSHTFSIVFSSIFCLIFGFLLPFKFSLFRILIGNFIKVCCKNESRKDRIGYQYLICLCIFPNSVHSLSFIIPFILQLSSVFIKDKTLKSTSSKLFLIFIQLFQTNTCQLIPIMFFQIFQKMNSFYFILGILQMMIPISFIHYLDSILLWIESNILSISVYGHINSILSIGFLFHYFQLIYNEKRNVIGLVLILITVCFQGYLNPFYSITFINVGQGDSILIQAPFHLNNTLIDIPKDKENIVIDYLHAIGVNKIDNLVFTHSDSDHNGGKEEFLKQFKVNKVIENKEDIKIFNQTLKNVNQIESEEDNDNSIVLFGNVGNMSVCLMGDASIEVEKDIIEHFDYNCDILKVGHHGSKTSTSPLFIQNVQPKIAIISAAKNNYYGHPHSSVMNTLKRYQVKDFETKNGAIQIKSFLKFQIIRTSEGEFDIILL